MKLNFSNHRCLLAVVVAMPLSWQPVQSQPFIPPPPQAFVQPSRNAQRAAVTEVRSQANWLLNATRTGPSYTTGGADFVWGQFQTFRRAFSGFGLTLFPQQREDGANEWAELSAGLDIIQEAFTNYQNDLASGRAERAALGDLCSILGDSTKVWIAQFNQTCARLRVGY